MKNIFITSVALLLALSLDLIAQKIPNAPYLLRKDIGSDSTWVEQNTSWLFINDAQSATINRKWLTVNDLEPSKNHFLMVNYSPLGSVQIGFEVPKNTKEIDLDTLSNDKIHLINFYYGYLQSEAKERGEETENLVSGKLNFTPISEDKINIDGNIIIKSINPDTFQEIIFSDVIANTKTLKEALEEERTLQEENQRISMIYSEGYNLITEEENAFYDSLFNLKKYPNNQITVKHNNLTFDVDFDLWRGKVLLFTETLYDQDGINEIISFTEDDSVKSSIRTKFIHDPIKNAIDDETAYYLSFAFDEIKEGKRYEINEETTHPNIFLVCNQWAPGFNVIETKHATGFIEITENTDTKLSAKLELNFQENDIYDITISGKIEYPKIYVNEIIELDKKLEQKLNNYLEKHGIKRTY